MESDTAVCVCAKHITEKNSNTTDKLNVFDIAQIFKVMPVYDSFVIKNDVRASISTININQPSLQDIQKASRL